MLGVDIDADDDDGDDEDADALRRYQWAYPWRRLSSPFSKCG